MTSPYMTGTVSVTAGSAVVTGSGTAWQTALVAGGLFGLDSSNGNPVPILSVDSNTQLTLAKPWRGTTASGQAYWIIRDTAYLQQLVTNAQALATYIQRLDNAALAALAGLTPAADKLAYFNGAATAVLTDLKAKGRDIISAADMSTILNKLGPVFGGIAPQPSEADVGLANGDFNTIIFPGVYTTSGTWANGPSGTASYTGLLEVFARRYSNAYWQILRLGTATWMRHTSTSGAATWPNPWMRIANETVGNVSQSGGIPTGAIIERGSNSNGEYVRFADGTQICWADTVVTFATTLALTGTWTYPLSFNSSFPRIVSVTADWSTTTGALGPAGYQTYNGGAITSATSTSAAIRVGKGAGANFASGDSVNTKCIAVGRWF